MRSEDVESIAEAVVARLAATPYSLDPERHANEHRFIAEFIEERKTRRERMEHFRRSVGGWFLITVVGGIGYAVWTTFVREFGK